MNKRKLLIRKSISFISSLALVLQSLLPTASIPLLFAPVAHAQEVTVTPTDTVAPTPTPTIAVTPTDTTTPTATIEPTATPTPVPTTAPTDTLAPTPTVTITATPTDTITPTPLITLTTTPTPTISAPSATILTASISTDKTKYSVGEPMTISGVGFSSNTTITISILRPDHVTDTLTTKSDSNGSFSIVYSPPGISGRYKITATDGVNSAKTATTEADAVSVVLDQCAQNDSANGHPLGLGNCNWIGSELNSGNSTLYEGIATEQQVLIKGTTTGAHTFIFGIQATKGGIHSYDWLVSDAKASGGLGGVPDSSLNSQKASLEDGITLNLNRCGDQLGSAGGASSDKSVCNALLSGATPTNTTDVEVPDDPYISKDGSTQTRITAYESHFGNRTIRLYTDGTITVPPTLTLVHMTGKSSGSTLANGADTGDSYIWFTLTWSSTGTNAMIVGGADIALSGDGTGRSWGAGKGAAGITGSPYHFYQISLDGTGGSEDNQMAGSAVFTPPVTPTIVTNIHLGSNHTTDIQNTTIAPGSTIHDSATLTSTNGTPTGNVNFRFYTSSAACTADTTFSGGTTAGTVALSSGVADPSSSEGPLAGGTYAFKAQYTSNDARWTNVTGGCEVVTVQGTSTVTTTLHKADHSVLTEGGSVALGSVIHDLATVTVSGTTPPSGNVDFRFYSSVTACTADTSFTGGITKGSIALNGANPGIAHPSTDTGSLSPGSYAFKAKWAGDSSYTGNISGCETFSVGQGTSTVTTTLHKADHSVLAEAGSVPLGSVIHDLATVTPGGSIAPTGNVDFRFYNTVAACTSDSTFTGGTTKGSVALDGANPGVAHPSTDTGSLGAGTYAFKAKWAGDTNYTGNISDCETFTVNKAPLTVTTTVHDASHNVIANNAHVPLGTNTHDNATVTGGVSGFPIPAISFNFQSSSIANGSTDAGFDATSIATGALGAGSYTFNATVASNDNYTGSTSDDEPFTVDKAQLGITTEVHDASHADITSTHVPLGTVAHDNATVTGGVSGYPIPAISFTFNGGAIANGTTESGFDATSVATSALGAGNYKFNATVAGDNNYLGATSSDEPFTVDKAQLAITTEVHDASHNDITGGSIKLGSTAHDNATVTGGVSGFPIPAITFNFNGTPIANGTTESGFDATTISTDALGAGSYTFNATVAGNDNYVGDTSDDEPFSVNKAQLAITTEVHDTSHADITGSNVPLGTVAHDNATVSGGVSGFAIPAISFTFNGGAITNGTTESGFDATTVPTSALGAGDYKFNATVASNDNYTGSTSDDEPFTVDKAPLTITTTVHDADHNDITNGSIDLGSSAHDNATVTGAVSGFPIPDITFTFNGNPITNGTKESGFDATTVSTGPLGAGNYKFNASVASDDNYTGDTSADEPFTVNKAQLAITTEAHDASHADITDTHVPLGTIAHDNATVTGGVSGYPIPAISFTFNGGAIANGTTESGFDATSVDTSALGAGDYKFNATVATDNNYLGATSADEPFTVDKAQLAVTTIAHNAAHEDKTGAMVPLSSIMHDTAVVTGQVAGFTAPDPTFTLTSNYTGTCTAGATVANNGTENGAFKSADSLALGAGNYAYRASVAGNSNYLGGVSGCEPFRVINPHTTISIVPNTYETSPGENVILTITDTNDGDVPLTNPSVVLTYGSTTVTLDKANYYVSGDTNNDGIMDPGESWVWSYTVLINGNTTFTVAGHGTDPLGNDISPQNGYTTEGGSTTVTVIGTTRTLGFWQTHTTFTSFVFLTFFPTGMPIGTAPHKGVITNIQLPGQSQLFGGFYAPIAKTTTGAKRTPVDQARITLLQQLLAAKLNCAAFGCSTTVQGQIATADADYASTNKNAIMADVSILGTYNNSGDTGAIPPSLPPTGKATPKDSQAIANLLFWNLP